MFSRLLRYSYANGKARALAAGSLKRGEIGALAGEPSRHQVLARLASRYPLEAKELSPEAALRLGLLKFGVRVAEGLPSRGKELILAYLRRVDALNIKTLCRGLLRGIPPETYGALLIPAGAVGGLGVEKLLRSRSLEELAGYLGEHRLAPALRRALDFPLSRQLPLLEMALDRGFWEDIAGRIETLWPLDRPAALELLGRRADLDWFGILRRAPGSGLSEKEILEGVGKPSVSLTGEKALHLLREPPSESAGEALSGPPRAEVERLRSLYVELRRTLVAPPFDISLPLAAVLLKELEVRDLSAILGGMRLHCDHDTIRSGLASQEE